MPPKFMLAVPFSSMALKREPEKMCVKMKRCLVSRKAVEKIRKAGRQVISQEAEEKKEWEERGMLYNVEASVLDTSLGLFMGHSRVPYQ